MHNSNGTAYRFFIYFIVIINIPNFTWVISGNRLFMEPRDLIGGLALSLLLSVSFLAVFSRPWKAWLAMWILCLWWLPLALIIRFIAETPITSTLIGTAFATSPSETLSLLQVISLSWLLYFALWNILCFMMLIYTKKHSNWYWKSSFRTRSVLTTLVTSALAYTPWMSWSSVTENNIEQGNILKPKETTPRALPVEYNFNNPLYKFDQVDKSTRIASILGNFYPYDLPLSIHKYSRERKVIDAVRKDLKEPHTAYSMQDFTPAAEVVVLVIGESSSRNAWHLFNTQAPLTTPLLEERVARNEYIFGFSQTLAKTTFTRQAVPSMLTQQPLVWYDGSPNWQATKSIISVANQANYKTAWFSNQAAVGKHDGIITSYAQEAEVTVFINPSNNRAQGSYDEVLLAPLKRHLAAYQRVFVVLHTMGSHFRFEHRYPVNFGLYQNTSNMREAYFNTVLYTDYILNNVIEALSQDGRKAVMVYASDHGQAIPGESCNKHGTSRTTRDAYEVPALVWLSKSYAQTYPELLEKLRSNTENPYSVPAVVQTVLDLMRGDATAKLPSTNTQSFLRTSISTDEQGQVTHPVWNAIFAHAVTENPCSIVLP